MNETVAASAVDTYATRKSVLEPETVWRLTADALVRERIGAPPSGIWSSVVRIGWRVLFPWGGPIGSDHWPERIAYDQIASIRVRFDPTRVDRVRERCDLIGPNRVKISLFSTRYKGFGDFTDQATTFKPFIHELTRRILAARPDTPVYSGLTWTSYLLQHGFLLLAVLGLASILGTAGVPAFGTIWIKILITVSYVGVLWAYANRNLPRRLNPPGAPAVNEILPSSTREGTK